MAFWLGLLTLLAVSIAIIVKWQREQQQKTSAAREREMLAALRLSEAAQSAAAVAPAPAPPVGSPVPGAGFIRKSRLLSKEHSLLFLLLKNGLPDHIVFANVRLNDLLEPAPALDATQRARRELDAARHSVDFVICSRSLEIVAVAELEVPDAVAQTAKRAWLQAAGIRYLQFASGKLPRHTEIRAQLAP